MNHVSLVGRFARDPHFADGETPKVYFTLAVKRWINDDGVDFIDLVTFGSQAVNVATHKHKGDLVAVDGRLHHNSFERNGETVHRLEVIATRVQFLTRAAAVPVAEDDLDDTWVA